MWLEGVELKGRALRQRFEDLPLVCDFIAFLDLRCQILKSEVRDVRSKSKKAGWSQAAA